MAGRNPWLDALEQRHATGGDDTLDTTTPSEILAAAAVAYELRAIREVLAHAHDPANNLGWHGALD